MCRIATQKLVWSNLIGDKQPRQKLLYHGIWYVRGLYVCGRLVSLKNFLVNPPPPKLAAEKFGTFIIFFKFRLPPKK